MDIVESMLVNRFINCNTIGILAKPLTIQVHGLLIVENSSNFKIFLLETYRAIKKIPEQKKFFATKELKIPKIHFPFTIIQEITGLYVAMNNIELVHTIQRYKQILHIISYLIDIPVHISLLLIFVCWLNIGQNPFKVTSITLNETCST